MTTIAEAAIPPSWRHSTAARALTDAGLVLLGSVLVALAAQVRLDLPFTPVPITGQTFGVLLVGAALGSRRGALAMLAYLGEGAAGLPVFAGGGCCIPWLLGPTAGYLWSYPAAAWLVGWLAEHRWDRRPASAALAMGAGNLVIYAGGLTWLAFLTGADRVLLAGLVPFVPGDLIKIVLAAAVLPVAWRFIKAVRHAIGAPPG